MAAVADMVSSSCPRKTSQLSPKYGETEEELLANAKKHGIVEHGYTEETWNEEVAKNLEHFRGLIKTS